MTAIFTPEDTVALKEDPSITAIVEQSWRDIDSGSSLAIHDWIPHKGVKEEEVKKAFNEGQLPKGLVVIRLCDPWLGCAVIKETDLILKDRGLVTGDVVKRAAADAQSGYVVKTELECLCQPIYADIPFHGSQKWDHKPEENEIRVPSEELTFPDLEEGKYVIYRGWVGEIGFVQNKVTVRLSNGSIVRVKKPEDLSTPGHDLHTTRPKDYRNTKTLATTLKDEYRRMGRDGPEVTNEPEAIYPGQRVTTTKSNLRLGEWVVGSYTPSVAPNVTIVDVRPVSIEVEWMTFNIFSPHPPSEPPPFVLDGHELEELIVYNKNNVSSQGQSSNDIGARRCQGVIVGEHVAFRDPAGAAVKYSESAQKRNETGVFRRIPRTMTEGFEMNTLYVRETKQHVRVQWQDGSITEDASTDVIPYLNVDENDLWPGELCSLKAVEARNEGMIKINKIGVVQSVNAKERMAKIRWFKGSKISVFEENLSMMVPGSSMGELSDEVSEMSVYEVVAYAAITRRRGDLVVVSPNEDVLAVQQASALDAVTIGALGPRTISIAASGITSERIRLDPQGINTGREIRFFGEIVDLGLDGLLTVRLGALEKVEDIKVPITRVFVVVGGDEDEGFPMEGDEAMPFGDEEEFDSLYSSDEISSLSSGLPILDETIEYEGGERLDNGDEDAWMTDEDVDGDEDDEFTTPGEKNDSDHDTEADPSAGAAVPNGKPVVPPSSDQGPRDVTMADAEDVTKAAESSQLLPQSDYDFSKFSNRPDGFEILDVAPPDDHHYASQSTQLSAPLLRRIRKEHGILQSSLPDGIWVRTWTERLDILRILILGPRATPYELAPFVLDVQFKEDFPNSPPHVYFHSWTNRVGRINPNLYEDGKVCLSILGTWPENEKNEGWNRERSSLLQVLVSLMGLVLVEEPYYNEAGFESLVGSEDTLFASQMYSEKAYCMAKGFVEHALAVPVRGIDEILRWLYLAADGPQLLALVVKETREALLRGKDGRSQGDAPATAAPRSSGVTKRSSIRLSTGAEILIKRFLPGLERRLAEL